MATTIEAQRLAALAENCADCGLPEAAHLPYAWSQPGISWIPKLVQEKLTSLGFVFTPHHPREAASIPVYIPNVASKVDFLNRANNVHFQAVNGVYSLTPPFTGDSSSVLTMRRSPLTVMAWKHDGSGCRLVALDPLIVLTAPEVQTVLDATVTVARKDLTRQLMNKKKSYNVSRNLTLSNLSLWMSEAQRPRLNAFRQNSLALVLRAKVKFVTLPGINADVLSSDILDKLEPHEFRAHSQKPA